LYETTKVLWPHRPYKHRCPGGTVDRNVPVRVEFYRDAHGVNVHTLIGYFEGVATYFGDWYGQFRTDSGTTEVKLHYIRSLRFYLEHPEEEV